MADRVEYPAEPRRSSVGCLIILVLFLAGAALMHWIMGMGYLAGLWLILAAKYESLGLRLPPYDPVALFVRLASDGTSVRSKLRLTTASVEDLRAFVLGQSNSGYTPANADLSKL
jgi:hypothetical protein